MGLQQIREEAKGAAATKQFAALLPKLAPDMQAALLAALAARGDKAARGAVLDEVKSSDPQVRAAALEALGGLGESADVALLVEKLTVAAGPEKKAAETALLTLPGSDTNAVIAAAMSHAKPEVRATLLATLTARHASDAVPSILKSAVDADPEVRTTAMSALAELASPDDVPQMLKGVLKANKGTEREAAERAVAAVCQKIEDPAKQAAPVLAAMVRFSDADQLILLSTLGRVGGPGACSKRSKPPSPIPIHSGTTPASGPWPTGPTPPSPRGCSASLSRSPIRSCAPGAAGLDSRGRAQGQAERRRPAEAAQASPRDLDQRRRAALYRPPRPGGAHCRALRFLLPFLDQPAFAQEACGSVLELAHHRELRVPNKAEFDVALDKVIAVAKSPKMVDEAQHYKRGETFNTKTQE